MYTFIYHSRIYTKVNGMQHIQSINMDLILAKNLCHSIRNSFSISKRQVLDRSATIISCKLKKEKLEVNSNLYFNP